MLSAVCMLVGLVLVVLLRDTVNANAQAGFWFGVILLLIGVATLAAHAHQHIVVDPQLREIRIEDRRLLGRKMRRVAFSEVQGVQVAYLQTRARHTIRYFLQLQLAGGEHVALFAPERVYAGAADPAVVARWGARLQQYLAAPAP